MCYSPVFIKNPNYGRKDKLSYVVDTRSQYIPVPCGHCGECIALRSASLSQRCQLESLFGYPYFITVTYNPESLTYYECSNGYKIPYCPISDLQNMFKRLRKSFILTRRFRYFAVSEFGSKCSRPHAHILLFLERWPSDDVYTPINLEKIVWSSILLEWRRNYGSTRKPDYRPLCTYVCKMIFGKMQSTYDCHFVVPSSQSGSTEDVSYYVSKYLLKDQPYKDQLKRNIFGKLSTLEEAQEVWSKVRPRAISSLNFGFGCYDDINPRKTSKADRLRLLNSLQSADIVRSCVERSSQSEKTAKFYDLETGKPMALSRYWYKFGDIYDLEHHKVFLSRQDRVDGVSIDDRDIDSKLLSEAKYIKNSKDSLTSQFDLLYAES